MKKEKELRRFPRKSKFKKVHRGTLTLRDSRSLKFALKYGEYAIKTISAGFLKWKVLIEAYKNLKRLLKRKKNSAKIWINVSLNWPISRKPKGTRMGKGKGKVNFDDWVSRVRSGKILFELSGVPSCSALKALRLAQTVLPIPSVLVKKI